MSTFGFGLLLEGRWVLAVKAAAGLSDGDDVAGHRRIVFEFAAELGDARGDDPAGRTSRNGRRCGTAFRARWSGRPDDLEWGWSLY
jgi:hypothetical protein